MRASPYLRQAFYRELAGRLRRIGYEPYEMTSTGFSIRGVEHLRERFSKRTREVKALTEEFALKKGRRATKREIEVLVRESRAKKLREVTTPEVRERQRAELTPETGRAPAGPYVRLYSKSFSGIGSRPHEGIEQVGEIAATGPVHRLDRATVKVNR